MRSSFKGGLSLLLLASANVALAQRKSLAYGPSLPHSKFVTSVPRVPSFKPLDNPLDVAALYLQSILPLNSNGERAVEGVDYFIRDDSYEDASTGVARIFVRQLVGGLEVADADISLNIKDGHVLSYGDSFFRGSFTPSAYNAEPAEDLHSTFCTEIQNTDSELFLAHGQTLLGGSTHINCNSHATVLSKRSHVDALSSGDILDDAKKAVLHFMIAAHPSPEHAHDIAQSFESHVDSIDAFPIHDFTASPASPSLRLNKVPGSINPVRAHLVYVQSPNLDETKLTLAWKFEVEMTDNWYEVYMDATHLSNIHSVIDWASDAALAPIPKVPEPEVLPKYNVWAWGINDPSEGKRTLETGYDVLASPLGWHSIPAGHDPSAVKGEDPTLILNSTTTWGNNVFAHENWDGQSQWLNNFRPSSTDLVFDYKYGPNGPNGTNIAPKEYINLTITQLFYTSNKVHDLFYRYGFDEASGNFQQHNFDRGGREGDAVIANAQDGSGYNNANFMTPPDGQNGRCRMYVWNTATPYRDGDLEAGIVIHELAHGLSTRITGGPANSGCLGWGESGGMGEGWGDFIATTARAHKKYQDFPMGSWAANQVGGIRNYPYSTNTTVNPSTYKTLDKPGYWGVHAIGEVWAEILWVVEQKLIAKHGWGDTLFPPAPNDDGVIPEGDFYHKRKGNDAKAKLVPKYGNTLLLQLVVDGMKLQPCRPSFFDARDAIIQADELLTGGANKCELWTGFSERGLGPDAEIVGSTPWGGGVRTDDYELPKGACSKK